MNDEDPPRPESEGAVIEGVAEPVAASELAAEPAKRASVPTAERAVKASAWALASFATAQLIRLGSNLILTRLLTQDAFGAMALIINFLVGMALLSDVGINRAIVQNPRGEDPLFQDTAWTLGVVRGFVLWLIAVALSKPLSILLEAPPLAYLLPVASFNAVVSGFHSTNIYTQNRKLAQNRIARVELGSQLLGTLVMIGCAFWLRSVWALIAGTIAISFFNTILTHFALPGIRNRFRFNKADAREMFLMGRWIFIATAIGFLGSQSDRMVLSKVATLETLGIYSIAFTLAHLPRTALGQLVWSVLFPVMSRSFENGDDPGPSFRSSRAPILLIAGLACATMVAAGPFVVDAMYDDRYTDAGWMLRIIAVHAYLVLMQDTLIAALIARGHSLTNAIANGVKVAALIVAVPLGHSMGGFQGALFGLISVELTGLIVTTIGAHIIGLRGSLQQLWISAIVAATGAVGYFAAELLRGKLPATFFGEAGGAVLAFLVVAVLWLPLIAKQAPALKAALKRS